MGTGEHVALVRRFYEALNRLDLAALDALLAPDVAHNGAAIGPEGVKQHLAAARDAFPDLAWAIEDQVASDDWVTTRYTYAGTQRGEILGIPPTGNPFRADGIALHRIRGGRIAEEWEVRDTLAALLQIGATLAPPAS